MFGKLLRQIMDEAEGGLAALVMGFDGLPIETVVNDSAMDVESIGMELSVVLHQIRRTAESLQSGQVREVSIVAEKYTTVIRVLSGEYFVAVVLSPNGNYGKAKFSLRVQSTRLAAELTA